MYGSAFSSEFEDSKGFGWNIPEPPTFDWKALISNKTREIERLNGIYKKMLGNAKVELFEGLGRVLSPHTVEVVFPSGDKKTFSSKYILIATGGRAVLLDIPGKEYAITSDEALSLEEFPKRVIVVGGGYIAVEFAGIFKGMGAEVDLIYRANLPLRGFDDEMRHVVANNLSGRGINIHPNTNLTRIEKISENSYIAHTDKGTTIETSAVMFATGRIPNTKHLNLESVGVSLDKHKAIVVNEYSQTNVPSIFAVGDVTNRVNLTPVALMEGHYFALTVFGNQPKKPKYEIIPSAVFCQPPLSVVGLTENQAIENAENDIVIFTSAFKPMKYTISGRNERTVMKLVVDSKSDLILGASMCGPDAPEIMQAIGIAMNCGATKKHFDDTVGIHPSAAEEFVTMRTPTRRVPPKKS